MTNRRPLTPEETADSLRLKAIYEARKNDAKAAGSKLTQADVAEACGWSGQSAFSQFATGKIPLNIEALLALAKTLDFRPEEVSPRLAEKIGRGSVPAGSHGYQEEGKYQKATPEHRQAVDQLVDKLLDLTPEQALKVKQAMELLMPSDDRPKD